MRFWVDWTYRKLFQFCDWLKIITNSSIACTVISLGNWLCYFEKRIYLSSCYLKKNLFYFLRCGSRIIRNSYIRNVSLASWGILEYRHLCYRVVCFRGNQRGYHIGIIILIRLFIQASSRPSKEAGWENESHNLFSRPTNYDTHGSPVIFV